MASYDLFIILDTFSAEGCPILALNLIEEFKLLNLKILLLSLNDNNNDLLEVFKEKDITLKSYNLNYKRFSRYFKILFYTFKLSRLYKPKSILCFPLGWHSIIAIAAKFAGVKNVCSHAGNPSHNIEKKIFWKFNLLIQIGRPFTNKIICCTFWYLFGQCSHLVYTYFRFWGTYFGFGI